MDLCHYTITTGDLRRSPRSEVGDDVLPLVRPLLRPGMHAVPGFAEYELDVSTPSPDTLAVTVRRRRPIVVFSVVRTREALDVAIGRLATQPGADLWAPACLVDLVGFDVGLHWIGDFERCLAWAWIEQGRIA